MSETTNDQPSAGAGLLDNVQANDETTSANTQASEIDHKAPVDNATAVPTEIPGAPKIKPEYLPDNFWDNEKGEANIEGLAKSWSDLRKTISQGKHKAPADGKYDISKFGDGAETNPMANTLMNFAKDHGLSQVQLDDLVEKLQSQAREVMGEPIDAKAEMAKLGPNANAVVDGMVNWARGLVNKGIWGADDFEEFKVMGGTANGLKALMKVREAYEGRIPIESAPNDNAPSKDDLYQMVAEPRYQTDAAYRAKVERLFSQTVK